MEVPEVDIVHDGERGEWFLSLGVVEGDGETLAEGVVIGDPEHISDEELKQLLTKADRIVYDLMAGRKIISVY